jgi:hypothetical protein
MSVKRRGNLRLLVTPPARLICILCGVRFAEDPEFEEHLRTHGVRRDELRPRTIEEVGTRDDWLPER